MSYDLLLLVLVVAVLEEAACMAVGKLHEADPRHNMLSTASIPSGYKDSAPLISFLEHSGRSRRSLASGEAQDPWAYPGQGTFLHSQSRSGQARSHNRGEHGSQTGSSGRHRARAHSNHHNRHTHRSHPRHAPRAWYAVGGSRGFTFLNDEIDIDHLHLDESELVSSVQFSRSLEAYYNALCEERGGCGPSSTR